MPHFYDIAHMADKAVSDILCQCPHGLMPHFYIVMTVTYSSKIDWCQCPHGLMPHFYMRRQTPLLIEFLSVSMPSRAYASFLRVSPVARRVLVAVGVNALTGLCLISTLYEKVISATVSPCVNALTGLCLISTNVVQPVSR